MTEWFSLEYTIPHTLLKVVAMTSENDWDTFLKEAAKKPSEAYNQGEAGKLF